MKKLIDKISGVSRGSDSTKPTNQVVEPEHNWFSFGEEEGQLSVDIYQTEEDIVVISTIAGASAKDIDISLTDGILTIRGQREPEEAIPLDNYFYRECYWGRFARSIILPTEVKSEEVSASLHNGVLTVTLPKANPTTQTNIAVITRRED